MKQWYETLFENYGKKYDNENFTQGTIGECDFIEKEINYNKNIKILDIGCGTGRHARDHNTTYVEDDFGKKKNFTVTKGIMCHLK